ncbi:MAG: hypothetical protein NZ578_03715 [Candidatus Binatia bacterium]|nr:hypothetical protein [Candidatus Binatia bacterium]
MRQSESAALLQLSAALTEKFHHLATQLSTAAVALRDPGTPPPEQVLDELVAVRHEFMDLRTQVLALAQACAISPLPPPEALASLTEVTSLLSTVKQAEEQKARFVDRQHRALHALERVLAIVHRDQPTFPPLVECQEQASALRLAISAAQWSDSHPAIDALADGTHPLLDLLMLIESQEELDDERWASLQETIERQFGRALAVAASRGKLRVASESFSAPWQSPTTPLPVPPPAGLPDDQQPAASPEINLRPDMSTSPAVGESLQTGDSTGDVAALPVPASHEAAEQSAMEQAVTVVLAGELGEDSTNGTVDHSPAEALRAIPTGHGHTEVNGQLPGQAEEPLDERLAAIQALLWQLIAEDKAKLAFHVASYLETRLPEGYPSVPAWLARSVALGRFVRHADGEIARLLQEDFAQFTPTCFAARDQAWNFAIQLLLVAAALQPTLLAPRTQAATLLHALHLPEEMPQLAQICRLLAAYGEGGEPLDPNVLRKGKEQAAWQTNMDELRKNVEAWCTRTLPIALPHPPATKVWRKWQEPRGVLHTLLSAIRQNDLSRITQVKRAVDQFSDDMQIKREVDRTDRELLGRRLGDDISGRALEQIRKHTREAVTFARRWIELQETRAGREKGARNEQAELLRQEVWSRHPLVSEELNAFKRRHPALPVIASVACCQRAFENIKMLFDPQASFPSEEPLPKPLLYADLLRIPAVKLTDQWELHDTDPEALIDGIFALIGTPQPRHGG